MRKENNDEKKKSNFFTKETLGVILVLFTTLSLVCMITRKSVFGNIGDVVGCFVLQVFGYLGYLIQAYLFFVGLKLLIGKKSRIELKTRVLIFFAIFMFSVFLHVILTKVSISTLFGENGYATLSYNLGDMDNPRFTVGGFVFGIISYGFIAVLSKTGTLVVTAILFAISVYFAVRRFISGKVIVKEKKEKIKGSYVVNGDNQNDNNTPKENVPVVERVEQNNFSGELKENSNEKKQSLFINEGNTFALKSKRELAKDEQLKIEFTKGGLGLGKVAETYLDQYTNELQHKIDYVKTPAVLKVEKVVPPVTSVSRTVRDDNKRGVEPIKSIAEQRAKLNNKNIPIIEHDSKEDILEKPDDAKAHADVFSKYANVEESNISSDIEDVYRPLTPISNIDDKADKGEEKGLNSDNETVFDKMIRENTEKKIENLNLNKEVKDDITEDNPLISQDNEKEIKSEFDFDLFTQKEDIGKDADNEMDNNFDFDNGEDEIEQSNIVNDEVKDIFGIKENQEPSNSYSKVIEETEIKNDTLGAVESAKKIITSSFIDTPKESVNEVKEEPKKEKEKPPVGRKYFKPSIDLLKDYENQNSGEEDHEGRMAIIKQTLEDFHVNAEPVSYIQGPTVTRYEVMMPAGVSVKRILTLDDDLRMRLASKNGVRIEAPIPGKNLVGIEVANKCPVTVGLKEIMQFIESKEKKGRLEFAIGKDIVGKCITDDLAKGPHFLVAGTTGSGKSVCLNIMIVSLIMRYSPEELRLVLVDPKGNEFIPYEHIPHLMIDEIITQPKKALVALAWAQEEMERRYEMLKSVGGARDIDSYNERIDKDTPKMARVVFVVDELSNLMESCKREMEARILSIAQKARAVGIHMVLATQRPSVDIITGTIKGNLPSRIALKVTSFADSSTILGQGGAEKLLGHGDMLYKNSLMGETERYQGAWITDSEIYSIVDYIKENNKAYFDDEMQEYLDKEMRENVEEETSTANKEEGAGDEFDDIFIKSLALAVMSNGIAISQLQRRFQMGYPRAGSIIDKMERNGFISSNEGSKARRVLISREEFEKRFGGAPESFS